MAETTETERYRAAWQDRRTRLRAIFAVLFAFAVLLYAVPSAVVVRGRDHRHPGRRLALRVVPLPALRQ